MVLKGKVYKFGNDVNTDEIIPARYLNTTDPAILARYCMEDSRPGFGKNVEPGSIIVAGENFGCGSSREHAPIAIKGAKISCVVAKSFARIFFRNCINIGLPIIENGVLHGKVNEGDILSIDLDEGVGAFGNDRIKINPFPEFMQGIIKEGGWIPYLLSHNKIER
jgi:3-isopropylmalate/(R)-2-methylmalate dehydratase small subunit